LGTGIGGSFPVDFISSRRFLPWEITPSWAQEIFSKQPFRNPIVNPIYFGLSFRVFSFPSGVPYSLTRAFGNLLAWERPGLNTLFRDFGENSSLSPFFSPNLEFS